MEKEEYELIENETMFYDTNSVLKEKRCFTIKREGQPDIKLNIIFAKDKAVFVDVIVEEKDFKASTYISGATTYLSNDTYFNYSKMVEVSQYYDGSKKIIISDTGKKRPKIITLENQKE